MTNIKKAIEIYDKLIEQSKFEVDNDYTREIIIKTFSRIRDYLIDEGKDYSYVSDCYGAWAKSFDERDIGISEEWRLNHLYAGNLVHFALCKDKFSPYIKKALEIYLKLIEDAEFEVKNDNNRKIVLKILLRTCNYISGGGKYYDSILKYHKMWHKELGNKNLGVSPDWLNNKSKADALIREEYNAID